jgi:ClpA/ClpB-like protein
MAPIMTRSDAIAAVERRAASHHPLAQLAAAVGVADELRLVTDELLGHFVERARASGTSWTEIGNTLGVSKQAAQQRFVQPPAPIGRAWPKHFTERARASLAAAQAEARALGHNYLGTEHLLLGLLSERACLASRVLSRLGVTADVVRARIEAIIGRGFTADADTLGIAPRAKRAMDQARREAKRLGHGYVGTEHLLLALAASDGVAAGILAELGADEARVRDELANMLGGDAPELADKLRHPPRGRFRRRAGA